MTAKEMLNTGKITLQSGATTMNPEGLVGKDLGEIRSEFADILNVGDSANTVVNGQGVDQSYVVQEGDTVEFVRESGTKG